MSLIFHRLRKLFWLLIAIVIRKIVRINNHKIFCWSYNANKYSCNPRAITQYLLDNAGEYEIFWAFNKNFDTSNLDRRIKVVRKYSLQYFIALYSSKFIFYNARDNKYESMFFKKKNQKYVMTWHGAFPLKKIERDAIKSLSERYQRIAKQDSQKCDLMLSNSKFFTNLIYNSFWYDGEILERCSPRNDIFYNKKCQVVEYKDVRKSLGLSPDCKIVLYAPTFRGNGKDLECYQINWDNVIPYFERMLEGKVEVLLRLHPNIMDIEGVDKLITNPHVHNVTNAPDITEFLFAADVMISDYTSAMFDFSILRKPCFIYAVDKDEYDRGFYWTFEQLPFSLAETEKQLIENIRHFNSDEYQNRLNNFIFHVWRLEEDGHGCQRLLEWMQKQ